MFVAGMGGVISQITTFLEYRLLLKLFRHGVDGEAVALDQTYYGSGRFRVRYQIRMPEEEREAEFRVVRQGGAEAGEVVAVVYDRRKPERAKIGVHSEINYKAEQFFVFLVGYGGLTLFLGGIWLVIASW